MSATRPAWLDRLVVRGFGAEEACAEAEGREEENEPDVLRFAGAGLGAAR